MISTCKSKKLTVLTAALLSLLMLMSLFTVSALAEEATTAAATEAATTVETDAATGSETEAGTEAGTGASTEASTGASTGASTEASTGASTGSSDKESEADKIKRNTGIINLIVGAILVVAIVAVCIWKRKVIPAWWKALKSECGKISWCPKDKLKKNTFVVLIIIVILAVVIGLLDYAFSAAIKLLGELVG